MYTVYVLLSQKDNRHYVGMTNNFVRRINEHNSGKNKSTKSRIPFSLVYSEEYESRSDARKREIYLKSASGRRFIDKRIIK